MWDACRQREDEQKTIKVGAGVAQGPREETAEIWRCRWSRVKRYADLTGGTDVVSGDDTGPRVGDLSEMVIR